MELHPTTELEKSLMERLLAVEILLQSLQSQDRSLKGETSIKAFDSGDTAWMLTSTALVLFMTIPGLALYYGGMIRTKNVIASVIQALIRTITTILL
jgi:Amt family ammonium transporter